MQLFVQLLNGAVQIFAHAPPSATAQTARRAAHTTDLCKRNVCKAYCVCWKPCWMCTFLLPALVLTLAPYPRSWSTHLAYSHNSVRFDVSIPRLQPSTTSRLRSQARSDDALPPHQTHAHTSTRHNSHNQTTHKIIHNKRRENPFFTNAVLEKTYFMLPEDDGVLEKAEGTKIEWKAGGWINFVPAEVLAIRHNRAHTLFTFLLGAKIEWGAGGWGGWGAAFLQFLAELRTQATQLFLCLVGFMWF